MTRRLVAVRAAPLAIAAILAAPGLAPALNTTAGVQPVARGDRTVTPKDDGKTVTVAKSRKLTISLKENGSTAYRWLYRARPNKKILRLVSDKTAQPLPGVIGGSVPRTIVYKALQAGTTKIKLAYVDFSGNRADALAITVKVR